MKQFWSRALLVLAAAAIAFPVAASAEQASQPDEPAAGHITVGAEHSCAVLAIGARCWGFGADRRLGYGTNDTIGDNEVPASVGPITFGAGLTATAISAGGGHTCALLSNATVRCWGFGGNGRLGYKSTDSTALGQTPATTPAVDVGGPVKAISAGESHTCALLVDGTLRCWGYGRTGALGYSKPVPTDDSMDAPSVGDDEFPASVGAVNVGDTATAISAGGSHTCAILTGGAVRCWGNATALGYPGIPPNPPQTIGDNETPNTAGPVFLGDGRTATAISAGGAFRGGEAHTCALLDDKSVRCWGDNTQGQLGAGHTSRIGITNRPGDAPPVALGANAKAITAGGLHSCALLEDGTLRCWGDNRVGQLGTGSTANIGDDEPPSSIDPVDLGPGRTALAVEAGDFHTCALLDDMSVRCWGWGSGARLGLCNLRTVGDNERPGSVGPVDLGAGGAACAPGAPAPAAAAVAGTPPAAAGGDAATPAATLAIDPRRAEAERRRALAACLRRAARRPKNARTASRRLCLRRHGRTPGRVTRLRARATSSTRVVLTFVAPGSDGRNAPAARNYLVRQSQRPLRTVRDLAREQALCRGSCRFVPTGVGVKITLTVTGLQPATTYYYSVAARDNVSNRLGPRSTTVRVRTPPRARSG